MMYVVSHIGRCHPTEHHDSSHAWPPQHCQTDGLCLQVLRQTGIPRVALHQGKIWLSCILGEVMSVRFRGQFYKVDLSLASYHLMLYLSPKTNEISPS